MHNISSLEIEKYLNWYESLTTKHPEYIKQKERFKRLKKAISYLEGRYKINGQSLSVSVFARAISGECSTSIKLAIAFAEQANKIDDELDTDLQLYFNPDLGELGKVWFLPTSENWHFLNWSRQRTLVENQKEFNVDFRKSMYSDEKDFAKDRLQLINHTLFEVYNYIDNIVDGKPLLLRVLADNAKPGSEFYRDVDKWGIFNDWGTFCGWVNTFDFAKWVNSKIEGQNSNLNIQTDEAKPTAAGVALYYWYLCKHGEHGLSDPETLSSALEKYKDHFTSKKNLQNQWNAIKKESDIIMIEPGATTIAKMEKLNRIKFAYSTLKANNHSNKSAIEHAEKHLKAVKQKIKMETV